jgi:hypothetical protein
LQAAAVVLNTHFVNLLLKSVRQTSATLPLVNSTTPTAQQTNTNLISALNNCRILAATTLAMFIRYATFIAAPAPKAREEHVLQALSTLLLASQSQGKKQLDTRLKRRAIAALGELVFYIASQEENSDHTEEHPWVMGPDVVAVILHCLKDDSDEIVRHYAAKVV